MTISPDKTLYHFASLVSRPLPRLFAAAVLVGAAGSILPANTQGLLGQPADVTLFRTNDNVHQVISEYGTQTIQPGGNTFNVPAQANPPPFFAFVTPTQIIYTATSSVLYGNRNISFAASEVGPLPATIIGVTVNPSTTAPGFAASHLTFDASDVYAEIAGVGLFQSGQKLVLDVISIPPPAVPEASTTVSLGLLLALGLGGVMVARRRKKRTT